MNDNKLQTVLIPRKKGLIWAIDWLLKHKYKVNKVDITDNYYRFRQRKPNKTDKRIRYYTISLDNGVELVFEGVRYAKNRK